MSNIRIGLKLQKLRNRLRLERLGCHVKSTTKSVEALEWFKGDTDQFDVIITEMIMPRMTGNRLAQKILKIRSEMPIIIFTEYSNRISEERPKKSVYGNTLRSPSRW